MSTVANDTTTDKTVAIEEQADTTSTDGAGIADLGATEQEQKIEAAYKASETKVVELAVATLDPKDMLKKYARLGKETLGLAMQRKDGFKAWAKQDYEKVCDQLETLVKMRVPIKDIRMDTYVRIYLWVEAVKALVPSVEKLSYFQVRYKFLPTLQFDPVAMTGEIRKEWLTWVRTTVEKQISDDPLPIKELDESIKERKEEIERERIARSKRTPEEALAAEQKAANNKLVAQRTAAKNRVMKVAMDSLKEEGISVNDVLDAVARGVQESGVESNRGLTVIDADSITTEECKMLASLLCAAGKIAEMRYLRDRLDAMIKVAENAMVTSNVA